MGDYNEDWYDLCTQHGYSMKDAYGYEDWMSANCDEDCLAEIEEMEQQMAYEENANEDEVRREKSQRISICIAKIASYEGRERWSSSYLSSSALRASLTLFLPRCFVPFVHL